MKINYRNIGLFALMALLLAAVGVIQSWSVAFTILNLCLISSIMALGVNIQWGYGGLLNVGIMGFAALGGVAGVLVSMPPVANAWSAGGSNLLIALLLALATIILATYTYKKLRGNGGRTLAVLLIVVVGYFATRAFMDPAVNAIEAVDPSKTGYLGGLGLPILLSWVVGGVFAAGAAWVIGKIALGLRSDYLAIATLGISEIIIAVLKNEDWLTRGVKNVNGIPRPVPYEVDLQQSQFVLQLASDWNMSIVELSSTIVKLAYAGLFAVVLLIILWLSERALRSPWGRMMRAIRDNETAAEAMGKDVTRRHLQVFVLGSAVVGIAGAMLTTLDGQFTPASYQPLRFTFLIWVMVIVGGSGNNWGSVLGGFVIWFFWVQAEPLGLWVLDVITSGLGEDSPLRQHLIASAAHMRLMMMGLILLLVLRFTPKGLIPETRR
ncbi:MAG: branched-chain amino acid ABC transporter permease [Alphaproteobacteria bacterium]|nr:branched-chain amino acid ABC transporter permease [Alphaproteobacteria bacterium]